jgi:DNA-binding transcriptional MerR regulator
LTPFTLRYYEKEGLMPPSKRLDNSHRVYSDSDIRWVTLINCLRSTGMSISDLKHYIDLVIRGEETVQERKQIILGQKKKIEEQLEELKKHLELINQKINLFDNIISKQVP